MTRKCILVEQIMNRIRLLVIYNIVKSVIIYYLY